MLQMQLYPGGNLLSQDRKRLARNDNCPSALVLANTARERQVAACAGNMVLPQHCQLLKAASSCGCPGGGKHGCRPCTHVHAEVDSLGVSYIGVALLSS